MKNLKERTLRGGFVKVCAQGANFLLRVGSLMILARLLDPKDFGLVGMVTAVTGVFGLFRDAGLSMVTIQRPTITNEEVSTLFWLNILVGTLLAALSLAVAPILVTFYHEPRLFWVTVVLAAGFVLNAAGVQHSALLQREMRFGALSAIDIASQVVSAVVGISLAMGGFGYWALVGSTVALPAISTLCVWLTKAWVPGTPHRGVGVGSMMRFGGLATLNGLVVYVAYNLEKVLLGRFWGAEALGIYGRAYQLINIPSENINAASGGVAFSVLSKLQSEPDRLRNYFLKGYSVVLALTLPITIACALFAKDIIPILLGEKWNDAVPIFQLLAPTILIFALINPLSWLLYSLGMVARSMKVSLVLAPLVMTSYIFGLPYGPTGVALAYSTVMTLWLIPHIAWCIHGTTISPRDLLAVISRPFISAIVAAVATLVMQLSFDGPSSPFLRLILGGSFLLIVYGWMLLFIMGQKAFYLDLVQSLRGRTVAFEKDSSVTAGTSKG
jgi:O-antigen/teichoic acid export membrane protein